MSKQYFTQDNTYGFSDADLHAMNDAVEILLDGNTDPDFIKHACDCVSDWYVQDQNTAQESQ